MMTAGCYGNWNHSSCPVLFWKLMWRTACSPIATASQSSGSSAYCLLQCRESQDSGLRRSSPFFPSSPDSSFSHLLLFLACLLIQQFWGSLLLFLGLSHKLWTPHAKGRKCMFLILHFICIFLPIFSLSCFLKWYPFFTSSASCVWISSSLSALWTVHEIYLLPLCTSHWHLFCCNCYHLMCPYVSMLVLTLCCFHCKSFSYRCYWL